MRPLLLLTAAAALLATPIAAKPPEATTVAGKVAGTREGAVDVFRGIPFAAPPLGQNRWRSPQPVAPWPGVRDAGAFGHDCMQNPSPADEAPLRTTPDEDCLYLNIWKPAAAKADARLPVLVWIYGGAFIHGGTSPAIYDGSAFARAGVVFASFNYRVGRFGFFSHPALGAEAGKPVGNFAMEDQVAALNWIKTNIAQFGGDPARVTIIGESAGGTSVINLMTMPSARGLFHGAIAMSGGGRSLLPTASIETGEQVGVDFAAKHGIADKGAAGLAAMRALPAATVQGSNLFADRFARPSTYVGGFVAEGSVITDLSDRLMDKGQIAPVPLMIGMTSADAGITFAQDKEALFASFGAQGPALRKAYDPDGTAAFAGVSRALTGDQYMGEPARFVARHAVAAGRKAYVYRFGYVAQAKRAEWKSGAPHATDIAYFFNTVDARYGPATTAQDRKAAALAHAYVVNFVKSGNPNGKSLPAWPTYDRKSEALLQHNPDATATASPDPYKAKLDLIEAFATTKR
ncbi:carboxylesterase/lipase family protein [Novosphingobium jiangmenense]|uniref:Carboxylic ester hydrolase n=1 Tax=Novosphingobium jiangmenense TaxID=2791981 RepID=A0ABS0HAW1_9SPHN|nr:carboxylesterase family protein [Novosphingobium jiangmenense]MBF9149419.1 carboxylesterase family protein [Novosphingobium jiangmenense]